MNDAEPKSPDRADLARALGELEAAKARVERDAKQVLADTRKKLVGELLPVLDNVDRAIAASTEPSAIAGMQLVKRQLEAVLASYGAVRFDAAGAVFDPQLHDAITTLPVTDPEQHRKVVDQIEPGYRFGDALLRPAKVVVGSYAKPAEPEVIEPEPIPGLPRLDPRFFQRPYRQPTQPARDPFAAFRLPTRRSRW
ncbi:MAG TPA: nucleotide exchange factor GrpE [Kofleriaceae bacterium]|nr:nucleotide exchange factor GrpE [Kofleriaceae bacterium]